MDKINAQVIWARALKNSLHKNLNFYVVGTEKGLVGDGRSRTDMAIFHLMNNLIRSFAGGITPLAEVSEPAYRNRNHSSSKMASFPSTRSFSDNLSLSPFAQ